MLSRSAYTAQSRVHVMLQSKFFEFSALTAAAAKRRLFLVRVSRKIRNIVTQGNKGLPRSNQYRDEKCRLDY